MAKIIQHQFFYPNPPEVVWEYLTKPELIAQWLMKNNFEPTIGHEFNFHASPMPDMDFDGIFYCKVLEIVPFKKLSYSWDFGPGDGSFTRSVVNWTLTEKDNGTELLLIHRGFEGTNNFLSMFNSMEKGWLELIQKLLKVINNTTNGTTQA